MEETSEQTIQRVLAGYEIGPKLRALRLKKKIGLVDLGKHTGLSASLLSQLENGKLVPTLQTLARIGMVFDVGLEYFFEDRRTRRLFHIVRHAERLRFPDRPENPKPQYFFECLAYSNQEKTIQAYFAEFPVLDPADVQEHYHEGAEFLFLIEGRLAIRYQDEEHTLQTGDSVYFDPVEPHGYRGLSTPCAKALVITTPRF